MPPFAFDRARHDRQAHQRTDDRWREQQPQVLVIGGEHVATADGPTLGWIPMTDAPDGEWIHLGEAAGRHHAAVIVERVPEELNPTSVRTLAPLLDPEQLSLAVHAVAMSRWLSSTPFCPQCGTRTQVQSAGHLRVCPGCGKHHFPRTDPAVIMLVTDDEDRALVGRQRSWPTERFSTLAGFVEPGEALEDAVRREVAEESGVVVGEVSYAGSQPWPFPASLMLGFFARATSTDIDTEDDELAEARWITRDELAEGATAGSLLLPPRGVSISSWLIEQWFGEPLPGAWF